MKSRKFKFTSMFVILSLIMSFFTSIPASATNNTINGATSDLLSVNRTVNIESAKKGDTFDARYTLTPNPISVQRDTTEKDIVVVIDTSISMDYVLDHNRYPRNYNEKSRLQVIKEVAGDFVEGFRGDESVNIALVEYNKRAKIDTALLNAESNSNVNIIINAIDRLDTDYNTNIGDGLRLAYYLLDEENGHEKYIVLMTDGYANTYSVNNNGTYYTGESTNVRYDCHGDNDPKGLEYAEQIAREMIAPSSIKSFIIGFSSEANHNNSEIATAAGGIYNQAVSESALSNVYNQIKEQIGTKIYGTGTIQETFNSNLEVATLPTGFSVSGNKVIGNFNIEYTLNSSKTQYEAKPITATVKYRVKENAVSILGSGGNSSFGKVTVSNTTQTKNLAEITIQPIYQNGEYLDISRSVSNESVKVGEAFTANYTLTPKPMPVIKDNTQKDIVLVVDTSGSMRYITDENREPYRNEDKDTRLEIIKEVATNFVNNFTGDEKINISLIKFSSKADKIASLTNMKTGNVNNLITPISNLSASGSTNIGDGLRVAYNELNNNNGHDKYLIFMTDGEAEAYSANSGGYIMGTETIGNNNIYATSWNSIFGYTWASPDYRTEALEYANRVATEKISTANINVAMIGFSSGAGSNNAQIANNAGANYYLAQDGEAISSVYNQIQEEIESTITGNINFQETFNDKLDVVNTASLPSGLRVDGNKVVGTLDIQYNLNGAKTEFIASPVNFNINFQAKAYGDGVLGEAYHSSYTKMSVSGYEETKYLDKRIVELKDMTPPTIPSISASEIWSKEPIAVTIAAGNDLESGVNRTEYKLTGLVSKDWTTYSGMFYVNNEGETVISARTIDNSENISQLSEKKVKIDMTPPTSPTITWDKNTHKVTIEAGTDKLSGVDKTEYCIITNGVVTTNWTQYNLPFTVSNPNNVVIKARTEDKAENMSDEAERELNSSKPQITMTVRDASGTRDVYNVTDDNNATRVDKLLDPEVKVQGEAYVDINLQSEGTDDIFQYKIIKFNGQPSSLNLDDIEDWNTLDLQQQNIINEDVVTEKQGYLNWRGYDVNHIQTGGNTNAWQDKDNVFKYPSSSISYKATTPATSKIEYGQWEDCEPYTTIAKDGKSTTVSKRWMTNRVFTNNITVDSGYSTGYKEASKFWGYIKVNQDGYYAFGGNSDDGSVAYLTVNGTTDKVVDMFNVQANKFGTTNKHVYLSKDKYYPIYLEYFNWGQAACFLLKYKYIGINDNNSTTVTNNDSVVPSTWFYPSQNVTPGEYSTTIFTGNTGVKIPNDAGRYYVVYRAGKMDSTGNIESVSREGIYGSFIVEQRAGLTLSREINSTDLIVGNEIEIAYTITPESIDVYSIYKEGIEDIPNTYVNTVRNFKYEDLFPSALIPLEKTSNTIVNGQKINVTLTDSIVYTRAGDKYIAQPIVFTVKARIDQDKEYLLEGESSKLTYTDIDNAQRQLYFNDLSFEPTGDRSSILKQGIFVRNNVSDSYIKSKSDLKKDITVVQTFPITLAMIAEVNNSQSSIKVVIDNHYKQGNIVFKKYELGENGEINTKIPEQSVTRNSSKNTAMILNDSDTFGLSKGKKYLIVYTIIAEGNEGDIINVNSYINNLGEASSIKLIITKMPKLQ